MKALETPSEKVFGFDLDSPDDVVKLSEMYAVMGKCSCDRCRADIASNAPATVKALCVQICELTACLGFALGGQLPAQLLAALRREVKKGASATETGLVLQALVKAKMPRSEVENSLRSRLEQMEALRKKDLETIAGLRGEISELKTKLDDANRLGVLVVLKEGEKLAELAWSAVDLVNKGTLPVFYDDPRHVDTSMRFRKAVEGIRDMLGEEKPANGEVKRDG